MKEPIEKVFGKALSSKNKKKTFIYPTVGKFA